MRNEGVMGSALNTVDSPEGTRCTVVVVVAVVVLIIVLAAVLTLSNGIIRYCGAVMAALGAGAATGEVVARPDGGLAVLSIMRKCGAATGAAVRSAAVLIVVGVDSVVLAII